MVLSASADGTISFLYQQRANADQFHTRIAMRLEWKYGEIPATSEL